MLENWRIKALKDNTSRNFANNPINEQGSGMTLRYKEGKWDWKVWRSTYKAWGGYESCFATGHRITRNLPVPKPNVQSHFAQKDRRGVINAW